jgi:hypothetical protein
MQEEKVSMYHGKKRVVGWMRASCKPNRPLVGCESDLQTEQSNESLS